MDPIHRQVRASLSPGTYSVKMKSARACTSTIVSDEDGREGVEEGGAFVKSTDHSKLCWCNCRMGRDRCSKCSAENTIIFSWSSRFTSGMIEHKTSTAMSLATWRGTGMRNQTEAVSQMRQNEKNPISRKSHWYLMKQVLLKRLCFSQLKATGDISHHKIIYSMQPGWFVCTQNLNFEVPYRKTML